MSANQEEDEDECPTAPCPQCREPLESYWNVCPRCEAAVLFSSVVACQQCGSKCAEGSRATLSDRYRCRRAPSFVEQGAAACCRVALPGWRLCPDCKCRLAAAPRFDYHAQPDEHVQRGLMCTHCPLQKEPLLFHCSTTCFEAAHRQPSVHAQSAAAPLASDAVPAALPVRCLDAPYPLSSAQIDDYRRRGHVLLPGLLSPDAAAALLPWLIYTAQRKTNASFSGGGSGAKPFVRTHNLWQDNHTMQQLVHSRRLAAVAGQLLGSERVRLYQDSAFFKEPSDRASPWHQDLAAAPFDTDQFGTLWLTFTEITADHGPLAFADASHLTDHRTVGHRPADAGRSLPSRSRDGSYVQPSEQQLRQLGFAITPPPPRLLPGDATFHAGWTFHGAAPNTAATTRYALAISYFADGAAARADTRPIIFDDYPTLSLLALAPSEPVRSKYTPILSVD